MMGKEIEKEPEEEIEEIEPVEQQENEENIQKILWPDLDGEPEIDPTLEEEIDQYVWGAFSESSGENE